MSESRNSYVGDRVELFHVVTHFAGDRAKNFEDIRTHLEGASKKRCRTVLL